MSVSRPSAVSLRVASGAVPVVKMTTCGARGAAAGGVREDGEGVTVRARSPRPRHTHVRHRVDLGAQLHAIFHRRGVQRQEGDAADAGVAKRAAGHGHGRAQGGRALRESAAEAARAADHKYVFARQCRALRRFAQRHDLQSSARLAEHGLEEVRKRVSRAVVFT